MIPSLAHNDWAKNLALSGYWWTRSLNSHLSFQAWSAAAMGSEDMADMEAALTVVWDWREVTWATEDLGVSGATDPSLAHNFTSLTIDELVHWILLSRCRLWLRIWQGLWWWTPLQIERDRSLPSLLPSVERDQKSIQIFIMYISNIFD